MSLMWNEECQRGKHASFYIFLGYAQSIPTEDSAEAWSVECELVFLRKPCNNGLASQPQVLNSCDMEAKKGNHKRVDGRAV